MDNLNYIEQNLQWIKSGKIGCNFAALFAKNPSSIGWHFIISPDKLEIPEDALMLSIVFPNSNKDAVKEWALSNGFYLEVIDNECEGLRFKTREGIAWVQYFGFDADVKTRQCPVPMLTLCVKLPPKRFVKVGFRGVLHIAHACVSGISDYVAHRLWDTSFKNTEKQLGHKPTVKEAAKTTYHV